MVTGDYESTRSGSSGSGSILKDGKIGAVAGGLITTVFLYIGQAVGSLDITPLPDMLEPAATGIIATVSMWFITKAAPRR